MKVPKLKASLVAMIAAAGFAMGNASAAPIVDTLISAEELGNSGDPTLLARFEALTGNDYDLSDIMRDESPTATLVDGVWVINVAPEEPGYFVLKFGTGGTSVDEDHYFFENIGDLTQLVFTNEQVNNLTGGDCGAPNEDACNIGRLSFYAWVPGEDGGGPPGEVPEPASLALLGAGALGMLMRRRRR